MPYVFLNHPIPMGPSKQNIFEEDYKDPFIIRRNMATPDVSVELEADFREWGYNQAIFINAPTGTGKSTFVLTLLRHIKEHGGRLLLVYNRLALGCQYKRLTLNIFKPGLLRLYTSQGIQETNQFDDIPVTFCTYQRLPAQMGQDVDQFTYAVFDEAHFFTADALFARDTWTLLKQLPQRFKKTVRIYMTATPWSVQNLVARAEEDYKLPLLDQIMHSSYIYPYPNGSYVYDPSMLMYKFPAPHRNYKLHALPSEVRDNIRSLVDLIKDSPVDEKWIIYVNSKENGKELARALGNSANYIDAEHKSGPVWERLTTEEKFPGRVLVTTAVTDCGVNINDPAVKHVVLFSTDHVQFLQELGRKRIKGDEIIHVYVPELSSQQWRRMEARNNQLLKIVEDFYQYPSPQQRSKLFQDVYEGDSREARHLLYPANNGGVHLNRCAEQVVRQRELFYQKLEEMWTSDDKHPLLRIVCQWLGLPDDALADALGESDEDKLLRFLNETCEKIMDTKEKQEAFASQFRVLFTAAYGSRKTGSRRKDPWGAGIIQTELDRQKIPYELTAQKGVWLLTKKETEVSSNV